MSGDEETERLAQLRDHYQMLGVLLAVLALLLMPIYSDAAFDLWDLGLALIGIMFSGSYIYRIPSLSLGEAGMLAAILGVSVAITTAVVVENTFAPGTGTARSDNVRSILLIVSIAVGVAAFAAARFRRS